MLLQTSLLILLLPTYLLADELKCGSLFSRPVALYQVIDAKPTPVKSTAYRQRKTDISIYKLTDFEEQKVADFVDKYSHILNIFELNSNVKNDLLYYIAKSSAVYEAVDMIAELKLDVDTYSSQRVATDFDLDAIFKQEVEKKFQLADRAMLEANRFAEHDNVVDSLSLVITKTKSEQVEELSLGWEASNDIYIKNALTMLVSSIPKEAVHKIQTVSELYKFTGYELGFSVDALFNNYMVVTSYRTHHPIFKVIFENKESDLILPYMVTKTDRELFTVLNKKFLNLSAKLAFYSVKHKDLLMPFYEMSTKFFDSKSFITPEQHQLALKILNEFDRITPDISHEKIEEVGELYNLFWDLKFFLQPNK